MAVGSLEDSLECIYKAEVEQGVPLSGVAKTFKFEDTWDRLRAINCLTVQTGADTVGNEHNKLIFFLVALTTIWGYDHWRVTILEVF